MADTWTRTFTAHERDWQALDDAREFIGSLGFSVGRLCGHDPIGVKFGDNWDIQKWRNLNYSERNQLDGRITGNWRRGPVTISMKPLTPEARAALPSGPIP